MQEIAIKNLSDISGGNLHNAIPREADAIFASEKPQNEINMILEKWKASLPDGAKITLNPLKTETVF